MLFRSYANDVFVRVSGYTEAELLGQPHSLIRHPDMPRAVFKLLWDTIEQNREVFAYVVNLAKNGDHYWVLAHVTPSFSRDGHLVGFHSNRRAPAADAVSKAKGLYAKLVAEEKRHRDRAEGLAASVAMFGEVLRQQGMDYEEFVFSLGSSAAA